MRYQAVRSQLHETMNRCTAYNALKGGKGPPSFYTPLSSSSTVNHPKHVDVKGPRCPRHRQERRQA